MYRSSADNMLLKTNEPLSGSASEEELNEEVELYSCENEEDAPMSRAIAPAEPPVVSTSG